MKKYLLILSVALSLTCSSSAMAQSKKKTPLAARLNHIAMYVVDLNTSADFYASLLSLEKIEEPFKDGKHVWFTLGPAGALHLIQGAQQKATYPKDEHMCFSVVSITDFIGKLDQRKIEYSNWPGTAKAPTVRVDGVKQIYFQDPDRHWIEVNDAP
jgi:lactoylglutathione lyase